MLTVSNSKLALTMAKDADDFIPTRQSLLTRLKSWDDQESWREFFDTYWNLIYGLALKSGLTEAEAQDAVQETLVAVARKMPGFNYDPAIGSFKSWLFESHNVALPTNSGNGPRESTKRPLVRNPLRHSPAAHPPRASNEPPRAV